MSDASQPIDPQRLYAFAEAAPLIPSCQAGKHVCLRTLHSWRKEGRLIAVPRQSKGRTYWFVYGAEILRLLGGGPVYEGPTPSELRRRHEQNLRWLREQGMKV